MNRALLVSSSAERNTLSESLERTGLDLAVAVAETCATARPQLKPGAFEVVIVQRTLPDGGWCNVLHELLDRHLNAVLVVVAQAPDGWSWSIPVQRGGQYALSRCRGDLRSVIKSALRRRQANTADHSSAGDPGGKAGLAA